MNELQGWFVRPFLYVLITLTKVNTAEQIASRLRPVTQEEINILLERINTPPPLEVFCGFLSGRPSQNRSIDLKYI